MDITFFRGSMAGGEGRGGGNVNSYGSGDRSVSLSLQTSYCCTNKNTEISEKFWHELSDYLVSLHRKAPETWGKIANAFHLPYSVLTHVCNVKLGMSY